jgi:rhodanese-related sulfurtransferase
MKKQNLLSVLIIGLFLFVGCKEDEKNPVTPPVTVDESTELAKYVEANGDYIYNGASFVITAAAYKTAYVADPTKIYTIDIRSAADYNAKRLKGAVNVSLANLYTHIKGLTLANYTNVVVTCYSGQTSAYGVSLVRSMLPLAEGNKIVSLKWGMSSIDSSFATNYWLAKTGNTRATQFVSTDPPAKPVKGVMPVISTGMKTGKEILEARVNKLLTDGFNITITEAAVYANLSGYFIANYWPLAYYKDPGHIDGAYNYATGTGLKPFNLDSALTTLPTNKPVVLYCYTGQTSAYVGAYLKMLGYDIKSLSYGANSMIFDKMVNTTVANFPKSNIFRPAIEIMGYKDLLE